MSNGVVVVPALLESAHMQLGVVGPPVGQPVDQPRIAVVGEDDRLVGGEQRVELVVGQPVRVFGVRLQPHDVDDVDHPHRQVGQFAAQDVGGGQRLQRRDIAGAGQHHVGHTAGIAGPVPDTQPAGAVRDGGVHVQIGQRGLLACDDHVDVVAAAQAVIGHRQQRVGVRRQVDAHHFGSLVGDVVDESGVLVRRAVVVLAPNM